MLNEIIFFLYCLIVCIFTLIALYYGKETIIAFVCILSVLLNFLILKEINLFGLTATACDALGVGITLSLNLIQEHFNYYLAKKTIWISFFCSLFYLIITQLHIQYIPSAYDVSAIHYNFLLTPGPRIIIASLGVYLIVQHLETKLYKYLSTKLNNFILRNYTSVSITQFIDTVLFSFLGLYKINEGLSNVSTILEIILISYIIKIITIAISIPILSITKKFITYP